MVTKHIPVNPKQYAKPIGPEPEKIVHYDPNQYAAPIGPARPTPYQKIGQSVRNVTKSVASAAGEVYSAGAQARSAVQDIGRSPNIRAIAGQSGFSSQSPRSKSRRNQPEYPDEEPPEETGERIYMTICDARGHCRQKTIKGGPKKPRQVRGKPWAVGGLGSFGNDPGLM